MPKLTLISGGDEMVTEAEHQAGGEAMDETLRKFGLSIDSNARECCVVAVLLAAARVRSDDIYMRADMALSTGHVQLDTITLTGSAVARVAELEAKCAELHNDYLRCAAGHDDMHEARDEAVARAERAEAQRDKTLEILKLIYNDWIKGNFESHQIARGVDVAFEGFFAHIEAAFSQPATTADSEDGK
jgi:hypothetical protein